MIISRQIQWRQWLGGNLALLPLESLSIGFSIISTGTMAGKYGVGSIRMWHPMDRFDIGPKERIVFTMETFSF